jgi:hypothetical protein
VSADLKRRLRHLRQDKIPPLSEDIQPVLSPWTYIFAAVAEHDLAKDE